MFGMNGTDFGCQVEEFAESGLEDDRVLKHNESIGLDITTESSFLDDSKDISYMKARKNAKW